MISYKGLLLTLGQTCKFNAKNTVVCKGIHCKLHINKTAPVKSRIKHRKRNLKKLKKFMFKSANNSLCAIGGKEIISFCLLLHIVTLHS